MIIKLEEQLSLMAFLILVILKMFTVLLSIKAERIQTILCVFYVVNSGSIKNLNCGLKWHVYNIMQKRPKFLTALNRNNLQDIKKLFKETIWMQILIYSISAVTQWNSTTMNTIGYSIFISQLSITKNL